jgi:hypothetical protein
MNHLNGIYEEFLKPNLSYRVIFSTQKRKVVCNKYFS